MKTILMTTLCGLVFGLLVGDALADEGDKKPVKEFVGKWNNRKYNSSGPLKCVARPGENGMIEATFSGTFMGDPFTYDVEFSAKPGRAQTDLSGKSTISGHVYEWSGNLKGNRLYGKYLGTNGYNGEFVLEQSKESQPRSGKE